MILFSRWTLISSLDSLSCRAKTLDVKKFPYLGRIVGAMTTVNCEGVQTCVISIEGQVQFDLLQVCVCMCMRVIGVYILLTS